MDEQKPEEVKPQVISTQIPEDKASGLAITSMVLGIVSIVCTWVIGLNFALGIAALITGIIELKKIGAAESSQKGRGMALAGVICGSLAILGAIIYVIVIAITAVSASAWLPFFLNNIDIPY